MKDAVSLGSLRKRSPYSQYKACSLQWLRRVPVHWDIAPVYSRYDVELGKMLDEKRISGRFLGRYVRNVDVQWDEVNVDDLPEMDFAPTERSRYLLRPGDLLVCEGGEVGRTALWRGELEECFYQKAIHRLRPRSAREHPRFFFYLMRFLVDGGVFASSGNSNTIDHLTSVQLSHYRLPFPPFAEQSAVAAFLDRETAKIDKLLTAKRQLIESLHEKRTALIARAVTKGIDPMVRLVTTGSLIFPKAPQHWNLRRFRRLIRLVQRPVVVEPETEYREIGIRSWGKGIFHKDAVKGALLEDKSVFRIEEGDFVLNIVFAWEGAVAVVSERERGMIASHRFPTFRHSEVDLDYLLMLLQSEQGRALMGINSPGAAGRNRTIRLNQFLDEEVPLPPLQEQQKIVSAFRTEEAHLETLQARIRDAVVRLKELRIYLIASAVTGKIDVRDEAA